MSLLPANISILCDPTCYVCDPSEERGSGAEWGCCTWGYFSPSLKSRTISQNSKQWGSQAGVWAAVLVPLQDRDLRLRSFVTAGAVAARGQPGCWPAACPRGPPSAHCHSSCSCLSPTGWPLQQCRTSPTTGGRMGVAWGRARDGELRCGIYFQLCHKLPVFVFGANHSKSLSSVCPYAEWGWVSALSSWEWSLNRESVAGWVQDGIKEWLEMMIMWEVY